MKGYRMAGVAEMVFWYMYKNKGARTSKHEICRVQKTTHAALYMSFYPTDQHLKGKL